MDVVLEITDTLVLDHIYAFAYPKRAAPYDLSLEAATNGTEQTFSSWHFEPASKLFHLNPGPAAYQSEWDRSNLYRQFISLFLIVWLFGLALYFIFATLSYAFVFDKKTMEHPKYLKNQVWAEIKQACTSMPFMSLLTAPFFILEINGYTKLYDTTIDGPGLWYDIFQFPFFLFVTDSMVYMIHRGLHHPLVYKRLHKPHHKWIMPTPYAAYAFHPVDGWAQSLPYHIFPMLFPLNKFVSAFLFVFVNFWSILIHDGEYMANSPVINGAACHTMHHLYFNYNYGQYTTLWDRLGGSYRKPDDSLFEKETKMSQISWKKQIKEMEKMVVEVEGVDDRDYDPVEAEARKNK